MIVDAVLSLLHGLAMTVISGIPEGDPFGDVPDTAEYLGESMGAINVVASYFPWYAFVFVIALMLGVMVWVHAYRLILFILGLVHITGNSE